MLAKHRAYFLKVRPSDGQPARGEHVARRIADRRPVVGDLGRSRHGVQWLAQLRKSVHGKYRQPGSHSGDSHRPRYARINFKDVNRAIICCEKLHLDVTVAVSACHELGRRRPQLTVQARVDTWFWTEAQPSPRRSEHPIHSPLPHRRKRGDAVFVTEDHHRVLGALGESLGELVGRELDFSGDRKPRANALRTVALLDNNGRARGGERCGLSTLHPSRRLHPDDVKEFLHRELVKTKARALRALADRLEPMGAQLFSRSQIPR